MCPYQGIPYPPITLSWNESLTSSLETVSCVVGLVSGVFAIIGSVLLKTVGWSFSRSTADGFLQTQISWLTESHKVCWNSFYLALWRTSNFGFILHFLQYLGTLKLAMGRYFHVQLERQREKTSHSVLKRFCLVLEESLRNIWRQHLPVLSKPSNLLQLPTPVNKLLIYFSHRSD